MRQLHRWTLAMIAILLLPVGAMADSSRTPDAGSPGSQAESAEICLDSTCFPAQVRVGGEELPARGVALFRYWGFRVYTASLYVEPGHEGISDVLSDVPKRLVLHYHREISGRDIARSTEAMIRKNPENDTAALRERLEKLYASYRDVRAGDEYTIEYEPGRGTSIFFNGEHQLTIEGQDFARAFFGIWLSEHPVSESLRDELLDDSKAG